MYFVIYVIENSYRIIFKMKYPYQTHHPDINFRLIFILGQAICLLSACNRILVMKQLILIFLIIGISTSTLMSQHPLEKRVKRFEIISTEHGLSSSTVRCIFEDSRGFLWIGTLDGLNRYDSHGFKIFRNNPYDSTSLLNDQIVSVDEDYDGQLWISLRPARL